MRKKVTILTLQEKMAAGEQITMKMCIRDRILFWLISSICPQMLHFCQWLEEKKD